MDTCRAFSVPFTRVSVREEGMNLLKPVTRVSVREEGINHLLKPVPVTGMYEVVKHAVVSTWVVPVRPLADRPLIRLHRLPVPARARCHHPLIPASPFPYLCVWERSSVLHMLEYPLDQIFRG